MANLDTDTDEAATMKVVHRLVALDNIGLSLGTLFRGIRELYNIPLDDFAARVLISPEKLRDIEENRAPFPTLFLLCIFNYGISAWYNAGDDIDAN